MHDARDTGRTRAISETSRRRMLAGGAAALVAGAAIVTEAHGAPAGADAEVIALADEIMRHHAETSRDYAAVVEAGRDDGRYYREVVHPDTARCWEMRARLAQMPATTLAGFRAKARVVQEFNNCIGGGNPYSDDAMAWSLANDLLGVPSEWTDEEGDRA